MAGTYTNKADHTPGRCPLCNQENRVTWGRIRIAEPDVPPLWTVEKERCPQNCGERFPAEWNAARARQLEGG